VSSQTLDTQAIEQGLLAKYLMSAFKSPFFLFPLWQEKNNCQVNDNRYHLWYSSSCE
jgi:hypothetical protein